MENNVPSEPLVSERNCYLKQVKPGFTNYQPQPKYSWAWSKIEWKEINVWKSLKVWKFLKVWKSLKVWKTLKVWNFLNEFWGLHCARPKCPSPAILPCLRPFRYEAGKKLEQKLNVPTRRRTSQPNLWPCRKRLVTSGIINGPFLPLSNSQFAYILGLSFLEIFVHACISKDKGP